MAILQNRRTVFSLSNSEVMSDSAPTSEAGITKSEGHDGFFIYSDKAFTLWFKDQAGNWSSYNTYNLIDLDDGVAFSWGSNTAAFVQTSEASHSIAVFIIETKTVGQYKNIENKTLNEAGLNRLDIHSNYKRVRMQNSGHTGEAYAIAIFDANGDASYVSAPVSGQREGKALGWDENGALGWITLTSAAVAVASPSQYWDGSSTSTQVGSNTLSAVTIDNTDGKYENGFFNFGTSGTKTPARVGTQVSLSTGVYTFSLWFKNKRAGSDFGSVIRQSGTGASSANYAMATHQTTNELGLHKGGASNASPGYGFFSSGYDMSSFEGDSNWNHLAVVADGTNSTFYVNGQQAGNVVANVVTSHFKELGAYDGNDTQVFAEGLDEVAYWDSALTAAQIATIYNSSDKLSVLAPPPEFTLFGDTAEADGVYTFDGSGDHVTYNRDHQYTDQFSISVWFKSDGASSPFDVIVSNHDGGAMANGNTFMLYPTGKLRVKTADSGTGTTGDALNLGSGLGDSKWHQIVVTWQANTTNGRNIYIDGSLVHQNNTGTAVYRTTAQSLMYLGGMWIYTTNSFSGNGFDGDITGFSIVNSILTAQQVSDSYVADFPPVVVTTPALYFDGSSTSSQIGTNSVSFVGGSALTTSIGKYDSAAFNFGTSGNKSMLLSTGLALNGTYTFSAWFYNKRSNNHGAFIKKNATGGAGAQYPLLSHLVDGDELGLHNGAFRGTGYSMSSLEGLTQWTHIAVVANGSNSTFYINGQQVGNVVSHVITATVQRIGGYGAADQTFAEALDEFAYWDSALSSDQIEVIYNSSTKLSGLV